MKHLNFAFILISFLSFNAAAQLNSGVCPKVTLSLPNQMLIPEQSVDFSVEVKSEQPINNLKYFWIISGGKIVKGQSESKVEFAPNEEDQGSNLGVAVKISGLPENCLDTISGIMSVVYLPIGEPVDSFGKVSLFDYTGRLDNFLVQLASDPNSTGLIELTFNKRDSRQYKISRLKNINRFLAQRKFDKQRILFAISEADREQSELWVIPPGVKFPNSRSGDYSRITE